MNLRLISYFHFYKTEKRDLGDISKEEYEENEGMCSDCYYEYYQQLDNELDKKLLEDEDS